MLEMMEIKIAPKKADQNPEIFIFSLIRSVIKSMVVFTTNREKPRDKNASGKVKTLIKVPKVALIKASTRAITK